MVSRLSGGRQSSAVCRLRGAAGWLRLSAASFRASSLPPDAALALESAVVNFGLPWNPPKVEQCASWGRDPAALEIRHVRVRDGFRVLDVKIDSILSANSFVHRALPYARRQRGTAFHGIMNGAGPSMRRRDVAWRSFVGKAKMNYRIPTILLRDYFPIHS
jgi:hypothetical protein